MVTPTRVFSCPWGDLPGKRSNSETPPTPLQYISLLSLLYVTYLRRPTLVIISDSPLSATRLLRHLVLSFNTLLLQTICTSPSSRQRQPGEKKSLQALRPKSFIWVFTQVIPYVPPLHRHRVSWGPLSLSLCLLHTHNTQRWLQQQVYRIAAQRLTTQTAQENHSLFSDGLAMSCRNQKSPSTRTSMPVCLFFWPINMKKRRAE